MRASFFYAGVLVVVFLAVFWRSATRGGARWRRRRAAGRTLFRDAMILWFLCQAQTVLRGFTLSPRAGLPKKTEKTESTYLLGSATHSLCSLNNKTQLKNYTKKLTP